MKMKSFAAALLFAGVSLAQQPAAQPKGPAPKSQKELEALQKVQQTEDPEQRIKEIDNVLENFADTDFKVPLLQMAVQSAQQARDNEKVILYGERTLQVDPKNYTAELAMAESITLTTREFDLDKEDKLKKAEKYANDAIGNLKAADAPPTGVNIPPDQWPAVKKSMIADGYASLGSAATLRKKYDDAVTDLKTAADNAPDPVILARLAAAYNGAKQPDNAIATADKVLAMSDAQPAVKQFAQQEKDKAQKLKGAK